jgi:lipopolysaccharide biosynthesis glycosyltransferase
MLNVFIGYDERQPVSYHVLHASIMKHASVPVAITPLILSTLPMKRRGLTPFTYSRFLCPYLCDFKGTSLFLDADILARADLAGLPNIEDSFANVAIVKNKLKFEWSSVMLFNNALCRMLTPANIDDASHNPLGLGWAKNIMELRAEWNHLVGYDDPNPNAKLVHFTRGVPAWPETAMSEHTTEWKSTMLDLVRAQSWQEIMGNSVHAKSVLEEFTGDAA